MLDFFANNSNIQERYVLLQNILTLSGTLILLANSQPNPTPRII